MVNIKDLLVGVLVSAAEDGVRGTPDNWPKIEKALDEMYDGNLLTERIADTVVSSMEDEYAEGIAKVHEQIAKRELPGGDV